MHINNRLEITTILVCMLSLIILIGQEIVNIGNKKSTEYKNTAINITNEKNNIIITEEDYSSMLKKCEELINSSFTSSSNINTSIILDDIVFVDSYEKNTKEAKSQFNCVNTVYFKDMTLASFLNNNGEMKSVVSVIDKRANTIEALDINKINTLNNFNEYNIDNELDYIGNLIVNIVKSDKSKLTYSDTYEYFTVDAYKEFIEQLDNSNSIENVEITFLKIGKSRLDIEYNDRIFIQLMTGESRNIFINALIKIDKDGKIFDIDIL